jgi:hypothetical protein
MQQTNAHYLIMQLVMLDMQLTTAHYATAETPPSN